MPPGDKVSPKDEVKLLQKELLTSPSQAFQDFRDYVTANPDAFKDKGAFGNIFTGQSADMIDGFIVAGVFQEIKEGVFKTQESQQDLQDIAKGKDPVAAALANEILKRFDYFKAEGLVSADGHLDMSRLSNSDDSATKAFLHHDLAFVRNGQQVTDVIDADGNHIQKQQDGNFYIPLGTDGKYGKLEIQSADGKQFLVPPDNATIKDKVPLDGNPEIALTARGPMFVPKDAQVVDTAYGAIVVPVDDTIAGPGSKQLMQVKFGDDGSVSVVDSKGNARETFQPDGTVILKDANGKVIEIDDPKLGRIVALKGTLEKLPDGSILHKDENGHVTEIDYKNGTKYTFEYDGDKIIGFTGPNGKHYKKVEQLGKTWFAADDGSSFDDVAINGDSVILGKWQGNFYNRTRYVAEIISGDPPAVLRNDGNGNWTGECYTAGCSSFTPVMYTDALSHVTYITAGGEVFEIHNDTQAVDLLPNTTFGKDASRAYLYDGDQLTVIPPYNQSKPDVVGKGDDGSTYIFENFKNDSPTGFKGGTVIIVGPDGNAAAQPCDYLGQDAAGDRFMLVKGTNKIIEFTPDGKAIQTVVDGNFKQNGETSIISGGQLLHFTADGKESSQPVDGFGKDGSNNLFVKVGNQIIEVGPDGKTTTLDATKAVTDKDGNVLLLTPSGMLEIGADHQVKTIADGDVPIANSNGTNSVFHLEKANVTQITENPPGIVMKLDAQGMISEVDFPGGTKLVKAADGLHLIDRDGDEGVVKDVAFSPSGRLTIGGQDVVDVQGNWHVGTDKATDYGRGAAGAGFEIISGNKIQRFDGNGNLAETDYVTWTSNDHTDADSNRRIGIKLLGPDEKNPTEVDILRSDGIPITFTKVNGQWQESIDGKPVSPPPKIVGAPLVDSVAQTVKVSFDDYSTVTYGSDGKDSYLKGSVAVTATLDGDHIEKNKDSGADVLYGSDDKMHGIAWTKGALGDANPAWQQDRTTGQWKFIGADGKPVDGPKGVVGDPVPHADGSVTFDMGNGTSMTYDKYGHIKSMKYGKNEIDFNISKDGKTGRMTPPGVDLQLKSEGGPPFVYQEIVGGKPNGVEVTPLNDGTLNITDTKAGTSEIDLPNGDVKTTDPDNGFMLQHPDGKHEYHSFDGITVSFDSSNQVISIDSLKDYIDVRKVVSDLSNPDSQLYQDLAGGKGKQISRNSLKAIIDDTNASPAERQIACFLYDRFADFSMSGGKAGDFITSDTVKAYAGANLQKWQDLVKGETQPLKDPFDNSDLKDSSDPRFKQAEAALLAKIDPTLAQRIEDKDGRISIVLIDQALKNPQSLTPEELATLKSLHDSFYLMADARGVLDINVALESLTKQGYGAITDVRLADIATQLMKSLISDMQGADSHLLKDLTNPKYQPLTRENLQALLKDDGGLSDDEKKMVQSLIDSYGAIIAEQKRKGAPNAESGISLDFLAYEAKYVSDTTPIAGAWDALYALYSKSKQSAINSDNSVITTEFQPNKPVAIEIDYTGKDLPPDSRTIINYTVDGKTMTGVREPDGSILILQATGIADQYKVTRMVPVPGEPGKYTTDGAKDQLAKVIVDATTGIVSVNYGGGHTETIKADGSRSVCAGDGQPTITYQRDKTGRELETDWKLGNKEVSYKYDEKGNLTDAIISGKPPTYLHRADENSPWGVYADAGFKNKIGLLKDEDVALGPKGPEITGKNVAGGKLDLFASGSDLPGIPTDLGVLKQNSKGGWDLTKTADGSVVSFDSDGRVIGIKTQKPVTTTTFNYTGDNSTPDSASVYDASGKLIADKVKVIEPVGADGSYKAALPGGDNLYDVVTTDGLHAIHDKSNPKTVEYEDAYHHVVKIDYNDGSIPPVVRKFDFSPPNDPNGKLVDIVNPNGTMWKPSPDGKTMLLYASNGKDPIYVPGTFAQESMNVPMSSIKFDADHPGMFTLKADQPYPIATFMTDGTATIQQGQDAVVHFDVFGHVTEDDFGGQKRVFTWEPKDSPNAQLTRVDEPSGESWRWDASAKVYHHYDKQGNAINPPDDAQILLTADGTLHITHLKDNSLELETAAGSDTKDLKIKPSDVPVVFTSDRPLQPGASTDDSAYQAAAYWTYHPMQLYQYEFENGRFTGKVNEKTVQKDIDALLAKQQKGQLSADDQAKLNALQELKLFASQGGNATDLIRQNLVKPGSDWQDGTYVLKPGDTPTGIAQQYVLKQWYSDSRYKDFVKYDAKTKTYSLDPKIYGNAGNLKAYNDAVKQEYNDIISLNHIKGNSWAVGQVLLLDKSIARGAAGGGGADLSPAQIDSTFKPVPNETLPQGIQHLKNSSGAEVYKLADGLVLTKTGDHWTVWDKAGNDLGTVAAISPTDIASGKFDLKLTPTSGSPVNEILRDSTTGAITIKHVDGTSEVDFASGEKAHKNSSNQTDFISLPNGATIKPVVDGSATYAVYDDGKGHTFKLASMPQPADNGSFTATGSDNSGFSINVAPDKLTITANGKTETDQAQVLRNGVIERTITIDGVVQHTFDTKTGTQFVEHDKGKYHVLVNGKEQDPPLVVTLDGLSSTDDGFSFSIDGDPSGAKFGIDGSGELTCTTPKGQSLVLVAEALLKLEGKLPANFKSTDFNKYEFRAYNKMIWDEYQQLLKRNPGNGNSKPNQIIALPTDLSYQASA